VVIVGDVKFLNPGGRMKTVSAGIYENREVVFPGES
jgi:hypothetical protein